MKAAGLMIWLALAAGFFLGGAVFHSLAYLAPFGAVVGIGLWVMGTYSPSEHL